MPSKSQNIGSAKEKLAQRFLTCNGLTTITSNFHCPYGEIDLIMQDNATLAFIEVRYRDNANYGSGAESVTQPKQQKIRHTAAYFLQANPIHADQPCRFDVISIDKSHQITWLIDAFI